jgi:hypothetical protein
MCGQSVGALQKLDEPLTVVPNRGETAEHGEGPVNWGFYRTGSTKHETGKGAKTRMDKRAPQHGNYLTILTERGHLSATGPEHGVKSDLTKVFEQNINVPAPSKYIKQRDWTKNHEGKFFKKDRETFTEETMRRAKSLTKACPGFYKQSEKPKENKIKGHYQQKAKHRVIWDEFYAKGKAASKVGKHMRLTCLGTTVQHDFERKGIRSHAEDARLSTRAQRQRTHRLADQERHRTRSRFVRQRTDLMEGPKTNLEQGKESYIHGDSYD